jgi:hypothetical protein
MSVVEPAGPTAAGQAASDTAPLIPTGTSLTAREIAEFLRHLTELRGARGGDPTERAAFLHRKAELLNRLAADLSTPTGPPAAERRTP